MDSGLLEPLALAAALSAAAGLRFHGVVFAIGLIAYFKLLPLPGHLEVLAHPAVVGVSGLLFVLEFFADKLPWVDSLWDAVNTFIRLPGGAALAALAMADSDPGWIVAAALAGGVMAGGTHVAKLGSRALINLSPEPFSNWLASFAEDGMAAGIVLLALAYPLLALLVLALVVLLLIWLVPKVLRFAAGVFRKGWSRLAGRHPASADFQ